MRPGVRVTAPGTRWVEVVARTGPAWVQDRGRPGQIHAGVPGGGAWVPEGLARANLLVGNTPESAAIEACGPLTLRAVGGPVILGAGGALVRVLPGETWSWRGPAPWRVGYVAVRGGLDVPEFLGGRGALPTLDAAELPLRGLRPNDVLPVGTTPHAPRLRALTEEGDVPDRSGAGEARPCLLDAVAPIRVCAVGRETHPWLTTLTTRPWRLPRDGDRTGLPLEPDAPRWQPPPPAGDGPSLPMGPGAIQLPPSGRPVVLGPDHPTTGGYPVIGHVLLADLGSLAARPPGATVWFTEVGPAVAGAAHARYRAALRGEAPPPRGW